MAKKTHDIVATVGKYTDQGGAEKKRYLNVGAAFTNDDGNLSLKIEALPVTPEWSGWLSLYPVKEKTQTGNAPRQQGKSYTDEEQGSVPF